MAVLRSDSLLIGEGAFKRSGSEQSRSLFSANIDITIDITTDINIDITNDINIDITVCLFLENFYFFFGI